MGEIEVPADRYWGAQTQRSLVHFSIDDDRMPAGKIPTSRPPSWRCCTTKALWFISLPRFSACSAGPEKPLMSSLHTRSGDQAVEGSDILVAVGRTPNTHGIELELAGVALDARRYIAVNDRLETSAPGIWAIGEAKRLGINVRVANLPIVAVLRSRTISETRAFTKGLVEADGDRILGFTMLGPEAGEVMAVVQTAMLAGHAIHGLARRDHRTPDNGGGLVALFSNVAAR